MCILIGQQDCFHRAMKLKNDMSSDNSQFHERNITIYVRALYIVFLFVKSENDNFIKEIIMFLLSAKNENL